MLQFIFSFVIVILCVVIVASLWMSFHFMRAVLKDSDEVLTEKIEERAAELKNEVIKEIEEDENEKFFIKPDSKLFTGTRWDE